MEYRADYFNVLNRTVLNNPSVSDPIGSSTSFGTITGENGAGSRIAQFVLICNF